MSTDNIHNLISFVHKESVHFSNLIMVDMILHLCLAGLYFGYIYVSYTKNNMIYNWIHTNRIRIRKFEGKNPHDDNNTPMNAENIGIYKDYKRSSMYIYGSIGLIYILIIGLIYKEYKHAEHAWSVSGLTH